jgi:hypothetical protein
MEVCGQLHTLGILSMGKDTCWIEGWMGIRASLNKAVKRSKPFPCPCWELNPGHSACSLVTVNCHQPRRLPASPSILSDLTGSLWLPEMVTSKWRPVVYLGVYIQNTRFCQL